MLPLRALILGSAALTLAGCATSPATDFWNLAPIVRNTDASIDGRSETVKRGDTPAVHPETDPKPTYRWERTRPADRRWPAGIGRIAFVLAIMVPALWLVAGLADPGAGLVAFASSVAGFALLRSRARV